MAEKSEKRIVIRSRDDYRRSVQRAILAAKDVVEPKRGRWIKPLAIGLLGGVVAYYGTIAINTALKQDMKYESAKQQAQQKVIPTLPEAIAPAAAKASPIVANKETSGLMKVQQKAMPAPMPAAAPADHAMAKKNRPNTRSELISIINANAKCGERPDKTEYKISNMKEQLAKATKTAKTEKPRPAVAKPEKQRQAAAKPEKPKHGATAYSPPATTAKQDAAKSDTSSIWEDAYHPQGADSLGPMTVFNKAPECVQKYLTYGFDSLSSSKIRINLDKIIGGDERYLGIKLDGKVIDIDGSEKGGKKTCIIRLADKTFTIEIEKKGGAFSRKYADIRIQEKGVSTPYTKNAWLTVDTKGEMGGDGSSLVNLSVMAISVKGAKQSASF